MCGIVGYLGQESVTDTLMDGLKALEYRGYDSAGIAYTNKNNTLGVTKRVGAVSELQSALAEQPVTDAIAGIAHTRWATHGAPTEVNAHPHTNTDRTVAVVHNGIIENHSELREFLVKNGAKFVSQTDTEVIPHLLSYFYSQHRDPRRAMVQALELIRGSYAIGAIFADQPARILAARLSSPLVIGVGKDGYVLGSDATPLLGHADDIIYINDGEIADITPDGVQIITIDEQPVDPLVEKLEVDLESAKKGDYPHFMLKEIYEGADVIERAIAGRLRPENNIVKLGGLESAGRKLQKIKRIIIIGCGTSYYAGLVGEYLVEEIAGIPVEVELASEFRYRQAPIDKHTAVLAISQSGETADTLEALRKAKHDKLLTLGVVNVVGSSIARETTAGVYTHAGPELGVASTKAFLSQLSVLTLIALSLADRHDVRRKEIIPKLAEIPSLIRTMLEDTSAIQAIAEKYKDSRDMLFIGRRYNYPVALEGALKLKEVSYLHAEGYAAGEMKHGPLAMIDSSFPTVAIATDSELQEKVLSNMQEIRARSGPLIAIVNDTEGEVGTFADDFIIVPRTVEPLQPLVNVVALQLLAYYVGVARGLDVDRPRNLAKSVTVE